MSGDNVNMYGGSGNTGIQNNHFTPSAEAVPPELREAVRELLRLVGELRGQLPPASVRVLDDNLPALTGQGVPPQAPEERHRALLAVAGIAATVSTVGEPVVEAVRKVLGLLGAV
ncbi:DUF5955 family protein [Streptomyces laculatispora]|uniref:DUF5955 family protein n=1 Tax=Streptomyces laculatispora TaxID=887464 RepID=UPI001A94BBD7|nr:DUF5955 family protein [Streptomyces laculatispora]MBO0918545.1 hypothetical protein [Streptomyces laculatispora]